MWAKVQKWNFNGFMVEDSKPNWAEFCKLYFRSDFVRKEDELDGLLFFLAQLDGLYERRGPCSAARSLEEEKTAQMPKHN